MDDKRKIQNILNHSLSGLQENPFLAQRVIAQAKGEKPVKRKISLALVLCIVLGIAIIGTACALLASSQVADFFRQYWGKDMGDWLEEGKIAQVGESVTVGDVVFTLDEVVYRDRGIYGVGTARAVDSKNVLVPMDMADDWTIWSQKEEGKLLHLSGYELTWALDMDLDRIKTLGKEYNEYWYESGSGFTNSPRYDYDLAATEDEGYYLIYTQTSAAGLDCQ